MDLPPPLKVNEIIEIIFAIKIFVQNKHKGNKTKTMPMKPKLLKTLNMNQFWASSWTSNFIKGAYNTGKLEFEKRALIWSFNH